MPSRAPAFLLPCLLLAASAIVCPAAAQETPEATATEEPAARITAAPEPAESPATRPASGPGSPLDYEASEQISEDLSVSFPVDI
ncbi:MAG: hypothetical protein NXH81_17050 [Halieaceae bacterium]|uniref:hypothetical protein n=1 Tax=Haliea alexandrii TaxID=2448162 RepID=UPI000F0B2EB8|nr:hypothetical protein [Haliea alexandrii]MCR9187111.1 hypothetical protein [Halieaceae bacterium]